MWMLACGLVSHDRHVRRLPVLRCYVQVQGRRGTSGWAFLCTPVFVQPETQLWDLSLPRTVPRNRYMFIFLWFPPFLWVAMIPSKKRRRSEEIFSSVTHHVDSIKIFLLFSFGFLHDFSQIEERIFVLFSRYLHARQKWNSCIVSEYDIKSSSTPWPHASYEAAFFEAYVNGSRFFSYPEVNILLWKLEHKTVTGCHFVLNSIIPETFLQIYVTHLFFRDVTKGKHDSFRVLFVARTCSGISIDLSVILFVHDACLIWSGWPSNKKKSS